TTDKPLHFIPLQELKQHNYTNGITSSLELITFTLQNLDHEKVSDCSLNSARLPFVSKNHYPGGRLVQRDFCTKVCLWVLHVKQRNQLHRVKGAGRWNLRHCRIRPEVGKRNWGDGKGQRCKVQRSVS